MLGNYLKIVLAQLRKHKLHSLINILGLAAGIAACLLISLFVEHEISYDRYHVNADRIYRVSWNDTTGRYAYNSAPVGAMLQQEFPEIEVYARISSPGVVRGIGQGETLYGDVNLLFADNSLFTLFDFQWRAGQPANALTAPDSIVLTESLAARFFPDGEVVGRILDVGGQPFTVTGLIADLPDNTHLHFTGLMSWSAQGLLGNSAYDDWNNIAPHTYIMLREGAWIGDVAAGLPQFVKDHVPPWRDELPSMEVNKLVDLHLHGAPLWEFKPVANESQLLVLSVIAAAVLGIACINFMNLSTARGSLRAREIGVRKALGATRRELIRQFLAESLLTTALALIVALVLVEVFLPPFNAFVGKAINLRLTGSVGLLLALVAGGILTGVMAGAWPAFFLSAFRTVKVLKGDYTRGGEGLNLRNGMVVLQFATAITLLACTTVMLLQMRLTDTTFADLDMEGVVQVTLPDTQNAEAFNRLLLQDPAISDVAALGRAPFWDFRTNQFMRSTDAPDLSVQVQPLTVEPGFFGFFNIAVVAGRNFTEGSVSEIYTRPDPAVPVTNASFMINEVAARQLGWSSEEAVGKTLRWDHLMPPGVIPASVPVEGRIVGVIQDFNFETIAQAVKPLLLMYRPDQSPFVFIRTRGAALPAALAHIDRTWAVFWPELPVQRQLLTAAFQAAHHSYQQQGELIGYFAMLAIILACFGLFGLATFNAERRTREIGIRKVMGGSVWSIVLLLTNDFSKLVLLSNVIAWPLAYVAMDRWLQNFAYRIDLTPMIFLGSGLIALCVAWVTVGGTAAKAASQKPVLALRYE